jgi:transcription elongation factor SPT4
MLLRSIIKCKIVYILLELKFPFHSNQSVVTEILFFLDRFCRGIYAISVSGRLPAGVIREMKSRGIAYKPRDTSQR